MIPKNIERKHIHKAINEINEQGIPKGRDSRIYVLEYRSAFYPPKYVIALANKYANGEMLSSQLFSGGMESNSFLRSKRFTVAKRKGKSRQDKPVREDKLQIVLTNSDNHKERCPACKKKVHALLRKLYGNVETNYRLPLGSKIDDYIKCSDFLALKKIFRALQAYRKHTDYVRATQLPPCDFFVPSLPMIVEYDERQHFTRAREISLSTYPDGLRVNYDISKWRSLCRGIHATDKDPEYRDEQRAWYDTIRDFASCVLSFKPTARLWDKERPWCRFNQDNPADIEEFQRILLDERTFPDIELQVEPNPEMARLIIAGPWNGDVDKATDLLERICHIWPENARVKYFITCGGFLSFELPASLKSRKKGLESLASEEDIRQLKKYAYGVMNELMRGGRREKLAEHAEFMTIGIDSKKSGISTTQTYIKDIHAELVLFMNLSRENQIHFTGKSYPTNNQQKTLIRFSDYDSHFIEAPRNDMVMILGCHDLAIFSPRSDNSKGVRREWRNSYRELATKKKPSVVLQHPHTADSVRTWSSMWNNLERMLPSVKTYAAAGRYYRKKGEPRSPLKDVLKSTKKGRSVDFIVSYK